jgi:hypothetical protein
LMVKDFNLLNDLFFSSIMQLSKLFKGGIQLVVDTCR